MSGVNFNVKNFISDLIFHPSHATSKKDQKNARILSISLAVLTAGIFPAVVGLGWGIRSAFKHFKGDSSKHKKTQDAAKKTLNQNSSTPPQVGKTTTSTVSTVTTNDADFFNISSLADNIQLTKLKQKFDVVKFRNYLDVYKMEKSELGLDDFNKEAANAIKKGIIDTYLSIITGTPPQGLRQEYGLTMIDGQNIKAYSPELSAFLNDLVAKKVIYGWRIGRLELHLAFQPPSEESEKLGKRSPWYTSESPHPVRIE